MISLIPDAILCGILIGLVYSLAATGLTIIWGVMGIINFAHGDLLMLGMFVAFWLNVWIAMDPLFSAPLAALGVGVLALIMYRFIIRRIVGASYVIFGDEEKLQPYSHDEIPDRKYAHMPEAMVRPISAEEIAAVRPELMPCVPLAAHCEAQVTSEAQRLNIREGLSQESDVMGRLSEGEIVCLAGRSRFGEDGFRWWPIASWGGTGGWWWVAQGDPQEPERPWLTPTGRRCEE